jgi:Fe-S-cluster containining protein
MSEESITYVFDWTLEQPAFRKLVREIIRRAEKAGKVLALPMAIRPGQTFLDFLTILLAQVDCDGCDAPCCRHNPEGREFKMLPPEYTRLAAKYGAHNFRQKGDGFIMDMPCPFLRKQSPAPLKELCTIYPDRPLACVIYPFQPGATDAEGNHMLALASSCPEARRIAKQVYMTSWRIRRQYQQLGKDFFLSGVF